MNRRATHSSARLIGIRLRPDPCSRIVTSRGITGAPSTSSAIVPAPPSPSTGSPRFWPAAAPPERIRSALPRHKKRGTSIGPGRSRESSAADAQGVIHSL